MRKALLLGGIAASILAAGFGSAVLFQTSDLDRIQAGIEASHDYVEHLSSDQFAVLEPDKIMLFDVREEEEFAVSHLPGALRLDPAMSEEEFETLFADKLNGKRAVFYCSVGVRSSILAERVATLVERSTGKSPINLAGGLFKWHNERRSLVSQSGRQTNAIHPYDDYWGRLIDNQDAIRYAPDG